MYSEYRTGEKFEILCDGQIATEYGRQIPEDFVNPVGGINHESGKIDAE